MLLLQREFGDALVQRSGLTRCARAGRVCAEACGAEQPIEEMQKQRKGEWRQCLDLLHRLRALRAEAEELRASTPDMLAPLAGYGRRAAPGGGDEEDGRGEVEGVEEVRAMLDGARGQVEEWRSLETQERSLLRAHTDAAAAALRPEVRTVACTMLACRRSLA